MKSFFLIRPDRWFDQQGNVIKNIVVGSDDKEVPYVKSIAEEPIEARPIVDDVNTVPVLFLGYHVIICDNADQVENLAKQQNS